VSFDLPVELVFLLGWTEGEDPLHSSPTKSEPKPDKVFHGLYYYLRMTERYSY
jgi:hypothetical protein